MNVLNPHFSRFTKFSLIGVVNTLIDFALFTIFVIFFDWHAVPANIVAFLLALTNSYILNRRFTFKGYMGSNRLAPQAARFLIVHVGGLILSTGLVWGFAGMIGPFPAKLVAIFITVFWNYTGSHHFVFK